MERASENISIQMISGIVRICDGCVISLENRYM